MKITLSRRFFVLSFALLFVTLCWAQKSAKSVFDGATSTLTFYFDDNTYSGNGLKQYSLSEKSSYPAHYFDIKNSVIIPLYVVVDKSFADFRPKSTSYWFADLSYIEEITGLQYLNTSQVENMVCMFSNCKALATVDVSGFDTGNVTSFEFLFNACSSLKEIDVSSFDTSSATSMGAMFQMCENLESLDLSNFDTSNLNITQWMFFGCSSLKNLNLRNFYTPKVERMKNMFYGMKSIEVLDLRTFDTSLVKYMESMFGKCTFLKTIYATDRFVTTSVENPDELLFFGCTALVGGNGTVFNSSNVGLSYACIDGTDGHAGYFTDPFANTSPIPCVNANKKPVFKKYILNGRVVIEREGKRYDLLGRPL